MKSFVRRLALFVGSVLLLLLVAAGWYWFAGPCTKAKANEARDRLNGMASRWTDTMKVADSMPIIALAGPVGKLQDLRAEAAAMKVPPCMEHSRNLLAKAIELSADAYLEGARRAMRHEDAAAMRDTAAHVAEVKLSFDQEVVHAVACAPLCDVEYLWR